MGHFIKREVPKATLTLKDVSHFAVSLLNSQFGIRRDCLGSPFRC